MDFRRVEQPRGRVPGAHQQAYFRTAEDDALRAPGRQAADDRRERPPGGLGDRPETQLIEDDAIDERARVKDLVNSAKIYADLMTTFAG